MPGLLDDLIVQLKDKYGPNWEVAVGIPMPIQPGAGQGGVRSADDARAIAARGAADPTLDNISKSFNLGMGLMGGTGALTTGIQAGIASTDLGKRLGFDQPFSDLSGFAKPTAQQLGSITSGTPQQMQNQAHRMQEKAYAEGKARTDAARSRSMSDSASRSHAGGGFGTGRSSGRSSGGSSRGQRGE